MYFIIVYMHCWCLNRTTLMQNLYVLFLLLCSTNSPLLHTDIFFENHWSVYFARIWNFEQITEKVHSRIVLCWVLADQKWSLWYQVINIDGVILDLFFWKTANFVYIVNLNLFMKNSNDSDSSQLSHNTANANNFFSQWWIWIVTNQ